MKTTIQLALRNIFRNTRRTFLTVLLVSSGVVAMVFTDGLMIGMTELMISKVTSTWLGDAQIHQVNFRESLDTADTVDNPEGLYTALEAEPGIEAFAPRTFSGGMVASSNNVAPSVIYGVDPAAEARVSRLREALVEGEYLTSGPSSDILIGYKMAELLETQLGDRIVVTLSEAKTGELSQALFRVSGYLKFNDRIMDQQMAFVSLEAGQTMLNIGNSIHEIAIKLAPDSEDTFSIAGLRASIENSDVEVLGWQELAPEIAGMLEVSDFSLWIIGAILFVLVALGLINSMFMSIYERHYEFGVMLGLGTRSRGLFWLICCEGILIGTLGVILGLILGALLTYWTSTTGIRFGEMEMSGIMLNEPIRTAFSIRQFTAIPLFVIAMTAVACIIPAIHGARLRPADAMRRAL
jgi:ABC-type lipoprotein release transport system permease subunit